MQTFLTALSRRMFPLAGSVLLVAVLGCRHDPVQAINPNAPYRFPGEPAPTQFASNDPSGLPGQFAPGADAAREGNALRIGEKLNVSFSDIPQPGLNPHEQRIRDDGTITLPHNITVQAAGKTLGQLEDDIREKYVPRLYLRMTVTVQNEERWFYVGGEVNNPTRHPYFGEEMTLVRAIQSAGDFTDFADKKHIQLTRVNGDKSFHNWKDIIKKPELDPVIYPGDIIHVRPRWY